MAKQSGDVSVTKADDRNGQMPSPLDWPGPMMGLRGEIDRVFENFFKGWPGFGDLDVRQHFARPPAGTAAPAGTATSTWSRAVTPLA